MRRAGTIVALGALLGMLGGAATASPALARGRGWHFVPIPRHFTLSAQFCGFEIQGTSLVDKVYVKALKTADGSMILLFTGSGKTALTNPANGKTITENFSGPAKQIVSPDGSITELAKGHQPVALSPAEQASFGLPGLFTSAGGLTVTIAPDGSFTSLSLHGHILVNLCAALS